MTKLMYWSTLAAVVASTTAIVAAAELTIGNQNRSARKQVK
jgi:hypothetical protein